MPDVTRVVDTSSRCREPRPAACEDRVDDEMVLVDQAEPVECSSEHRAAHEHALRCELVITRTFNRVAPRGERNIDVVFEY